MSIYASFWLWLFDCAERLSESIFIQMSFIKERCPRLATEGSPEYHARCRNEFQERHSMNDKELIDMMESVCGSIGALCATFTEQEWKTPTDCPG